MKRSILIPLLVAVILMINFTAPNTIAQEQKAQTYYFYDQEVKLSRVDEHEALTKKFISFYVKHKFTYQVNVFQTNDFHYYISIPIEGLSAIPYYKAWNEVARKAGSEQWRESYDRFGDNIESWSISMITSVPRLSYIPENPRLKPEEANFAHITRFYVKPDKEREFRDIMSELAALFKRKNISDGYNVYALAIGTGKPLLSIVFRAKDDADYYSQHKKIVEILSEEIKALYEKIVPLLRKIERVDGNFRPDLSYTPEE